MSWQSEVIQNAERQIAWARANTSPGQIGAVPVRTTVEASGSADYPDLPLEALGDRPVTFQEEDHHRKSEEDFNALVSIELSAGRITLASAEQAASNFHAYVSGNRYVAPQTSPRFFQ